MKKISMTLCVLISMFLLGACTMEQDKSATGSPQESYSDFSAGGSEDMASDESGQQSGQTDSPLPSEAAGEGSGSVVLASAKVHVLMAGNVGDLGLGFLAYAEPEQEGGDYRLCFIAAESESEDLYKPLAELEFTLEDADYIFPDVRANNASIGRFLEVYYYDVTKVVGIDGTDVIMVAKYEADGKEYYDTRIYVKSESGYSADEALIRKLNEKYSEAVEYPIEELFMLPGEETPSQTETQNLPDVVFFGSWLVDDYRTSSTYALSQAEIEEFLTYGVAYYEDGFSLKGTMIVEGDVGYAYTNYTKEEVEEQFNINMTDWWKESNTIAYVSITSAESDFGAQFFAVDIDTIWIYYEGVFFQAKRAGA